MYRKKEWILIIVGLLLLLGIGFVGCRSQYKTAQSTNEIEKDMIVISIKGEVNKNVTIYTPKPMTYGTLWLKIKYLLNSYSDISGFLWTEEIRESITIEIPSLDAKNMNVDKIDGMIRINESTKEELMTLPQIGEKRSQKVLDYIKANGPITSYDVLWEVISIANEETQRNIMAKTIL